MKVLIAEDENISRRRLEKFLADLDYEVVSCKDGSEAWEIIQSEDAPHLLVLDWIMPGIHGTEICRRVRDLNKEPYTYILLLTSKDQSEDVVVGMEAGADDYITKPFNKHELKVRLRAGKRIAQLNEELLRMRNILKKQATSDELTGLHNRRYLTEILEREFCLTSRNNTDLACILFDIDFFKKINDTLGHPFGDMVLQGISSCLKRETRKTDILFRHGGEEFIILLPTTGIDGARVTAEKIRAACEALTHSDGRNTAAVTVSLGVASINSNHPSSGNELIEFADKALYQAKAEGRNRVIVYS
ncbi:MAG: diguanylate cyclase [Planctomycetes bacterium]|nr:diguanylate cyclase [Planctomycetota bacterium]